MYCYCSQWVSQLTCNDRINRHKVQEVTNTYYLVIQATANDLEVIELYSIHIGSVLLQRQR